MNSDNDIATKMICAVTIRPRIKFVSIKNARGNPRTKQDIRIDIKKYNMLDDMLKTRILSSPEAFIIIIISTNAAAVTAGNSNNGIKLMEPKTVGLSAPSKIKMIGTGA